MSPKWYDETLTRLACQQMAAVCLYILCVCPQSETIWMYAHTVFICMHLYMLCMPSYRLVWICITLYLCIFPPSQELRCEYVNIKKSPTHEEPGNVFLNYEWHLHNKTRLITTRSVLFGKKHTHVLRLGDNLILPLINFHWNNIMLIWSFHAVLNSAV